MTEQGKLIVLEGADDVALLRLTETLCRWIRECGVAVECTHEPTYGPAGTQISLARQGRLVFDDKSLALLYLADRLDHRQRADGIESWRKAGRHVVCRHSGLAAAARLWNRVDGDWLHGMDALCGMPDLTLYLDFPAIGAEQAYLRSGYQAAIEHLASKTQNIVIIDGTAPIEVMHSACRSPIARLLQLGLPGRSSYS